MIDDDKEVDGEIIITAAVSDRTALSTNTSIITKARISQSLPIREYKTKLIKHKSTKMNNKIERCQASSISEERILLIMKMRKKSQERVNAFLKQNQKMILY